MAPVILGLPYKEINTTDVESRDSIRVKIKDGIYGYGRQTYFIGFSDLKIREGFNLRKEYEGITDLADDILANGLTSPLVVDLMKDGTAYIEQGHRRQMALQLLHKRGILMELELPGLRNGTVECFLNPRETDELTRLKRQFSSNNGEKYTALEIGELCVRLATFFNMNQVAIAGQLGMSRHSVKNYMILAEQPDSIKQSIKDKKLTPTAAIELSRKMGDADERNNAIQESVSKGKKVGGVEAKRIIGDKDLVELPQEDQGANISTPSAEVNQDSYEPQTVSPRSINKDWQVPDELKIANLNKSKQEFKEEFQKSKFDESREEIRLCQNVIRNVDKIGKYLIDFSGGWKDDFDKLINYIQLDMENIRLYIHQNKKQ